MKVEEREAAGEFMAKQHYCGVDPEREAVWEAAKAFYVEARTVPADDEVEAAKLKAMSIFNDSAAMPGNEPAMESALDALIAAVSADSPKEQK